MKNLLTTAILIVVGLFLIWLALGVGYALIIYFTTSILYS